MIKLLEKRADGICTYEMENDDLRVVISSYGATILEIDMKGNDGAWHNTTLGYETIDDYMARNGTYFGALVGRVANRIAKGEYVINGKKYHCAINNGPNSLHGGVEGFSYKNFDSLIEDDSLVMTYCSLDGEEGYPGTLDLSCTFSLEDNTLFISYDAVSDADTLLSLTHHTYFNLADQDVSAENHRMQIDAERHGCVDENTLATGQFREVTGTPLDFRQPALIAQGLDLSDPQCANANGIDHHFVFEEDQTVTLTDPASGRTVTVSTTLPGAQIYSGNFIDKSAGRGGKTYDQHWGIAIEPQTVPDSIHNQEHPASLLRAGEPYHEEIAYTFSQQ